jgi:hypothetical protein
MDEPIDGPIIHSVYAFVAEKCMRNRRIIFLHFRTHRFAA